MGASGLHRRRVGSPTRRRRLPRRSSDDEPDELESVSSPPLPPAACAIAVRALAPSRAPAGNAVAADAVDDGSAAAFKRAAAAAVPLAPTPSPLSAASTTAAAAACARARASASASPVPSDVTAPSPSAIPTLSLSNPVSGSLGSSGLPAATDRLPGASNGAPRTANNGSATAVRQCALSTYRYSMQSTLRAWLSSTCGSSKTGTQNTCPVVS